MHRRLQIVAAIAFHLLFTGSTLRAQVRVDAVHYFPEYSRRSPLFLASDGNFYGTSAGGGPADFGYVYRLTPEGTAATLHEFIGDGDGARPTAGLVQGSDGLLYGTTREGGSQNLGTIYRMTLDGDVEVVHSFTGEDDGAYPPDGSLTLGRDGNLYGTSSTNGYNSFYGSVIFKLNSSGTFTRLTTLADGNYGLEASLVEAGDGNFYGVNWFAGPDFHGNVFRMTPQGATTVIYSFGDCQSGCFPVGGLTLASDGNLYGTTFQGGAYDGGTLFRLTLSGRMTVLHSFRPDEEGYRPQARPIQASDGFLYGSTSLGGAAEYLSFGSGVIYKASLEGTLDVLHRFETGTSYGTAVPLTEARDGNIYGVEDPGYDTNGVVFRLPTRMAGIVSIETPTAGMSVTEPFQLQGWAVDSTAQFDTGIDAVHVWARPLTGGSPIFVGSTGYGQSRPDVAARFGSQFDRSGFGLSVSGLNPGTYEFVVTPFSQTWKVFDSSAARSVTVSITSSRSTAPLVTLDTPRDNDTVAPGFTVSGWAVDLASRFGTGINRVNVWAYPTSGGLPVFLGPANYGFARPDVAATYGTFATYTGFNLPTVSLPLGRYRIVVSAQSSLSFSFTNATAFDVAVNSDPRVTVDQPSSNSVVNGQFIVSGWAIDRSTQGGPGVDAVHVWAFPVSGAAPIFLGVGSNAPRPDVADAFGSQFFYSGYALTVDSLEPGTYDVVVYARSTVTNTFNSSTAVRVTVE